MGIHVPYRVGEGLGTVRSLLRCVNQTVLDRLSLADGHENHAHCNISLIESFQFVWLNTLAGL